MSLFPKKVEYPFNHPCVGFHVGSVGRKKKRNNEIAAVQKRRYFET